MLPKEQRMTRQHFAAVFVSGKRIHTPFLQVIVGRTPTKNPTYAVVVSKKVAKTAVLRNKLRRVLYRALGAALAERSEHEPDHEPEHASQDEPQSQAKEQHTNQHSIILIAKKGVAEASQTEITSILARIVGHRSKSR